MAKDNHWMQKAFANSHGQFKAKAKKAGKTVAQMSKNPGKGASTKTKRQANLAAIGMKYGKKAAVKRTARKTK